MDDEFNKKSDIHITNNSTFNSTHNTKKEYMEVMVMMNSMYDREISYNIENWVEDPNNILRLRRSAASTPFLAPEFPRTTAQLQLPGTAQNFPGGVAPAAVAEFAGPPEGGRSPPLPPLPPLPQ